MTTEKEIRRFFKENRISFPEDDNFMGEVARRIDLLPVPSSPDNKDEKRFQEINEIFNAFSAWSRRKTIVSLFVSIACGIAAAFMSGLFSPTDVPAAELLLKSILTCAVVLLSRNMASRHYPPFRLRHEE